MARPEYLKDFATFRRAIAAAMAHSDAPPFFVAAIGDVDNEDGFAAPLLSAFDALVDDADDEGVCYNDNSPIYHDMFFDLLDYQRNAWNFEPGCAPSAGALQLCYSRVDAWSIFLDETLK